jgi:hypothetical protein
VTTERVRGSAQVEYILDRLDKKIAHLQGSLAWYRRRHYVSTMSTVLLSAGITILAGWKPNWPDVSNAVLVLGSLSTIISAWGAFFSPRETWLLYSSTVGRLRGLQATIEFFSRDPAIQALDPKTAEIWFAEYQQIMEDHNHSWTEMRSTSFRASTDTRKH